MSVKGTDRLGKEVDLTYNLTQTGVHMRHNDRSLYVEKKSYDSERLKDFKTVVTTWPEITSKKKAEETAQLVSGMFDQYGEAKTLKRPKRSKTGKR